MATKKAAAAEVLSATMTVYNRLLDNAHITQNGDVSEITDLFVRVDYRRPRASKFDALILPLQRADHIWHAGDSAAGQVGYRDGYDAAITDEVDLNTLADAGNGKLTVTSLAGYVYYVRPEYTQFAIYDTGAEPQETEAAPAAAKGGAKGGKGSKAAAAAEPEPEAETPAAPPAAKGGKGAKGAKGGSGWN